MKIRLKSLFRPVALLRSAAVGLLALIAISSHAITIEYQAINLTDTQQGQDLWQYKYCVSGYDFKAGEGFDIYFDLSKYGLLSNPQPDNGPDWFASASNSGTPGAPHIFDALAANPSSGGMFFVDFVWLGAGTSGAIPGSQNYDVYRQGGIGEPPLVVIDRGTTRPKSVPEGGPGLLLTSLALGALINPLILRRLRKN